MNKIYKTIWNESLGAWVAVSELTAAHGKRGRSAVVGLTMAAALGISSTAFAAVPPQTDAGGSVIVSPQIGEGISSALGLVSMMEPAPRDMPGCDEGKLCTYNFGSNGVGYNADGAPVMNMVSGIYQPSIGPNHGIGTTYVPVIITGVADGIISATSTDVVNGRQLYKLQQGMMHYYSVNTSDQAADSNYDNKGATGADAMAAGVRTSAAGERAVAMGFGATASGIKSIAIGSRDTTGGGLFETSAAAQNSIALGSGANVAANAPGGTAIGSRRHDDKGNEYSGDTNTGARVYAINGIAIGGGAIAGTLDGTAGTLDYRTIAIGDLANVQGTRNIGVGAGLVVGAGSKNSTAYGYSAAIGRTGLGASTYTNVDSGTAIGTGAQVMKDANFSTALGARAVVAPGALNSVAIGSAASTPTATADNTSRGAYVASSDAVALGVSTRVESTAASGVAIGQSARVAGASSISMGQNAKTNSKAISGIALGHNAASLGNRVISIGNGAGGETTAGAYTGFDNLAIGVESGRDNTSSVNVAIGYQVGNKVKSDSNVIIGNLGTGDNLKNEAAASVGASPYAITGNNVAIGGTAGENMSGVANTAVGWKAGLNSSGHTNLMLGALAGSNVVGKTNILLGNQTGLNMGSAATAANNNVGIGNFNSVGLQGQRNANIGEQTGNGTKGDDNVGFGRKSAQYVQGNANIAIGMTAGSGTEAAPLVISNTVAIGNAANSSANDAIAIGSGAKATAVNAISIGNGNTVSGANSGALGDPSTVSGAGSYSVGNNNTLTADNAFILGSRVTNAIAGSVVLGDGATASAASPTPSVEIAGTTYNFAGAAPISVVSVGAAGAERQIQNVAAGRISATSTDAINGSQLFATNKAIAAADDFAVKYDPDAADPNKPNKNSVTLGGTAATPVTKNPDGSFTPMGGGTAITNLASAGDITNPANAYHAVNAGDLNNAVTKIGSAASGGGFGLTDDGNVAVKQDLGKTIQIKGDGSITTKADDTGKILNLALSDNIVVGTPGAPGAPGKPGSIGIVGKDGVTTIKTQEGKPGLDGVSGTTTTRIVYTKPDGSTEEVATMNDGLKFAGNQGGVLAKKLNEQLNIEGKLDNAAAASGTNLRVDSDGSKLNLVMAKDLKDIDSITLNPGTNGKSVVINKDGINAGGNTITNVAPGVAGTDAVNKDQLDKIGSATTGGGFGLTDDGNVAVKQDLGKTIQIKGDGSITTKADDTGKVLNLALSDNIVVGTPGTPGTPGKPGSIGIAGKDGVTTIKTQEGKPGLDGAPGTTTTRIVYTKPDGSTEEVATMNDGLKFAGNQGDVIAKKLNEQLNIEGKLDNAAAASGVNLRVDSADGKLNLVMAKDLKDINSVTFNGKDGTPGMSIKGKDGSDGKPGLTIVGKDGKDGVGFNEDGRIVNVADGKDGKDAVNKNQLDAIGAVAGKGWNLGVNNEAATNVAPGATVDFSSKSGNLAITREGTKVSFDLANTIKIGTANPVTIDGDKGVIGGLTNKTWNVNNITSGQAATEDQLKAVADAANNAATKAKTTVSAGNNMTVTPSTNADGSTNYKVDMNKDITVDTINVGDTVKISKDGINAGDTKITNVADGTVAAGSKDAVNGGQLYAVDKKISDATGNINKGLNFGGDSGTAFNRKLGDTVHVKGGATGTLTDGNIGVSSDGKDTLTVKLAKDIDLGKDGSLKTGNTTINNNGLTIVNGPSITNTGVNAGGKTVTNVADGVKNSDAVNKGQLDKAISGVGGNLKQRIDAVENHANAGIAQAVATAGLPQAYLPGKSMLAIGGGYYRGEAGYAVGFSTISDSGNWVIKATGSGNSRGNYGASVGAGYQW